MWQLVRNTEQGKQRNFLKQKRCCLDFCFISEVCKIEPTVLYVVYIHFRVKQPPQAHNILLLSPSSERMGVLKLISNFKI